MHQNTLLERPARKQVARLSPTGQTPWAAISISRASVPLAAGQTSCAQDTRRTQFSFDQTNTPMPPMPGATGAASLGASVMMHCRGRQDSATDGHASAASGSQAWLTMRVRRRRGEAMKQGLGRVISSAAADSAHAQIEAISARSPRRWSAARPRMRHPPAPSARPAGVGMARQGALS